MNYNICNYCVFLFVWVSPFWVSSVFLFVWVSPFWVSSVFLFVWVSPFWVSSVLLFVWVSSECVSSVWVSLEEERLPVLTVSSVCRNLHFPPYRQPFLEL